jgi:hypothetical protein
VVHNYPTFRLGVARLDGDEDPALLDLPSGPLFLVFGREDASLPGERDDPDVPPPCTPDLVSEGLAEAGVEECLAGQTHDLTCFSAITCIVEQVRKKSHSQQCNSFVGRDLDSAFALECLGGVYWCAGVNTWALVVRPLGEGPFDIWSPTWPYPHGVSRADLLVLRLTELVWRSWRRAHGVPDGAPLPPEPPE